MLRLRTFCDAHGIKIQTHSPLASIVRSTGGPVDGVVSEIAEREGCSETQALLRWAADYGEGIVVTQSKNEARQRDQLEALTKRSPLSKEDQERIAVKGKERVFRHFQGPLWDAARP